MNLNGRAVPAMVCAILASAACGGSSNGGASGGQPVSVKVGVAAPVGEQLLPFLAQSAGLFRQQGIDADVTIIPASQLLSAISSGQVQFGVFAAPQPEIGVLHGAPIKWVARWAEHPDLKLLVAPGITSFDQLVGKRIGFTTAGATTQILANAVLESHGIQPSQVRSVPLGSPSGLNSAFISGQIDMMVQGPPLLNKAMASRPGARVLFDYTKSYDWPFAGVVAYMPYAESHRALTAGFLKAMSKSLALWRSSPSQAKAAISKATDTTNQASVDDTYAGTIATFSKGMVPSTAAEQTVLSTISGAYPDAKTASPQSFIDTSFLRAAGLMT
jgi:NitT/TauT family transport system substrate-binding protein